VLTAALDIALVATTLPAIRRWFAVSERSASWVLGIFVLFTLLGLPLMATLSDRYGRRTIYMLDLALFLLGGVTVITASSFQQLLVGRALQGLGASGIFPVASAVVGDTVAPERRGRMLGVLGSVFGVAFIIGPILGGLLVRFGWQWPFAPDLLLAAGVIALCPGRLPNIRRASKKRLDWPGILALSLLLGAFSIALNRIDTDAVSASLSSRSVWPFLLGSAVLLPVFLRLEKRAADPLLRLNLVARRQVALVCLFASGAGMVEAAFVFMADYATQALGADGRAAAFMLLPLVFSVALAAPLAGRLLDHLGSKTIIAAGLLLVTVGMGMLGLAPPTRGMFYAGTVGIGLGLAGLLGSALSYILLSEAEVHERTVALGINALFKSVGRLLGAAAIGAVAASNLRPAAGYRDAFVLIGCWTAVLLLLTVFLKNRRVEQADLAAEQAGLVAV
jgi:MFS family permease